MRRAWVLVAILAAGCSTSDSAIVGPTRQQLDEMVKSGEAFSVDVRTGKIKGSPPSGVVPLPPPPLPK